MQIKPTSEDCRIIRDCAQRSARCRRVELRPGSRYNLDGKHQDVAGDDINIAFVSDQKDWEDTDLADTFSWSHFTRGVDLTADGRGVFDFYVYSLGRDGELKTNVTAYYERGKLVRVDGTADGAMWSASVNIQEGHGK